MTKPAKHVHPTKIQISLGIYRIDPSQCCKNEESFGFLLYIDCTAKTLDVLKCLNLCSGTKGIILVLSCSGLNNYLEMEHLDIIGLIKTLFGTGMSKIFMWQKLQ